MFRFSVGKNSALGRFLLFQLSSLFLLTPLYSQSFSPKSNSKELILVTEVALGKPRSEKIYGASEFLKKEYSPASTFKTYLVLSLIENNIIDPKEKIECADEHIPNSPRLLDLRDAMFYSSNQYFEKVFPKLGKEKLDITLRKINYLENPNVTARIEDWWTDLSGLKHGGKIRLTPKSVHSSWSKIFENGYGFNKYIMEEWKNVLFWSKCPERSANVYGKTGSWGGSFWFQGALVRSENDYVIYTILDRSKSGSRTGTIQRFYNLVGCKVPSLE
ncbi:penicillin-binding transpeptidase domain-containing protein [Leptospira licerasiae]|uniref:Penicillin-binding protein, transpeptidase domain protein n=1 Tax=Leptospira licerasiae str. MMD4847 TaxID=1049971 RepID=A0ABP2R893_9LEPT|nr:penicillin-binding transpeptidase domain-containing protein [Leptospira licerasiae]EIE02724.1 penicillin-binding protein, transpeptidase domain protein [Leptospira licerasiae serovar Varillal str. VAR 010]EJZ40561.1 penicillin-binding protein, transpeptidase domain protein [Leptospira licerasiae str. MMD4847]